MAYKYYIVIGNTTREVTVYNKDLSIVVKPENGFIMREKLKGNIILKGDDYVWLKSMYDNSKYSIGFFYIKKNNSENVFWIGEFLVFNITFSLDGKAAFSPTVYDSYSKFLKNYEKEVNVLDGLNTYTVKFKIKGTLELLCQDYTIDRSSEYWLVSSTGLKIYAVSGGVYVDFGESLWRLWAREVCNFDNAGGSFSYLEKGKSFRNYTISYNPVVSLNSVIVVGVNEDGSFQGDTSNIPFDNYKYEIGQGTFTFASNTSHYKFFSLNSTTTSQLSNEYFTNNKANKFKELIQNLITKTETNLGLTFESDFFFGNNIITGKRGEFNNTFIFDNTNFKYPNGTNATINNVSFKIFFDSLNNMFKGNLFWYIDGYILRIEHKESISNEITLDTTSLRTSSKNLSESTIDKSLLFNREVCRMNESGSTDWETVNIISDIPILDGSKENFKEYISDRITTDIDYMLTVTDYNINGFLLVKCYVRGGANTVQSSPGIISLVWTQNEKLSLIRLHFNFNRPLLSVQSYKIETNSYNKDNTAYSLSKKEIEKELTFVYNNNIDYYKSIKTLLGNGRIDSYERNIFTDLIKVTLRQ